MAEDVVVLPAVDAEPDVWADEHPRLMDDEIDAGNALGEAIDVDDDGDRGFDFRSGEEFRK